MTYSVDEIGKLWNTYKNSSCYSCLVNGEWQKHPLVNGETPPTHITATSAKYERLSEAMEFPEFLERYGR